MGLRVAQLGQPILREVAQPLATEQIPTSQFQLFIDDMLDTMRASKGVGLAGPQVFKNWRVFTAAILPPLREGGKARPDVFINPVLSELSEDKAVAWEGCLSFLELLVRVPRSLSLRLDYLDRYGVAKTLQLQGFPARVVQHEYDHLDGILTIDRAVTTHDIIKASELDAVDDDGDDEEDEE